MGSVAVEQIMVTPLKRIAVPAGDILHAMNCADLGFMGFGEAYFSLIEPGAVKAWKRHLRMTLNLVVPIGMVRFVFRDELGVSREEVIGQERYVRLTVPPGIWFGFSGLARSYSLLLNIADIPHDPAEVERKNMNEFNLDWGR